MTRNEIKQKLKEKNSANYLDDDNRLAYFERLIKPYTKKGKKKYFIFQYLNGDGNELTKKFWSINSSSRFAFELYSWMGNDDNITDFEFEKKLESIKSAPRKPNIDVYIEIDNRVILIENKFTEISKPTIDGLSDSYYMEEAQNSKRILTDRYYGNEIVAKRIKEFVENVKKKLDSDKIKTSSWMDYKQEITHLIGIVLTIINNNQYKDKNIEFYNVFYDFNDEISETTKWFFNNATKLMRDLLVNRYCQSFDYDYISAQDLVKNKKNIGFNRDKKAYASDNTIGELLNKWFMLNC